MYRFLTKTLQPGTYKSWASGRRGD